MDFQGICEKQERTAISNHQQAPVCCMRVCFSSRKRSGVCQQKILQNIKGEVSLHIYTCLVHVYICMCPVCTTKCAYFKVSHTIFFQSWVYQVWQHTSVDVLVLCLLVSYLSLYIGQHSQPSVRMIVRERKCEKVSFVLLQKLMGLSVRSSSHSLLLPALWLADKHTWRFPCSYTYNVLPWLRVWFHNWSWIVHGVGLGPYNVLLVGYHRLLLWTLSKIWEMSFLWSDETQIFFFLMLAEHCNMVGNIDSNSLAEHSF